MAQQIQKIETRQRLLWVLPVLIFPFITMLFWSLGGGKGKASSSNSLNAGFNAELPGAENKGEPTDKLGFYSQAEKEALERQMQQRKDPYYRLEFDSTDTEDLNDSGIAEPSLLPKDQKITYKEPNEEAVYRKINTLQATIRRSERSEQPNYEDLREPERQKTDTREIRQLEQMMDRMNNTTMQEDPQMKQVGDVLESILDLQYPERVHQRLQKNSESNRGNVYPVSLLSKPDPVSILGTSADPQPESAWRSTGFYGLLNSANDAVSGQLNLAIRAVIHEGQSVVSGSTVKLRMVDPVYISGVLVPRDHFVFGTANLNGERLSISITSVRFGAQIFPVQLSVYDLDGLQGVFIPGAISRDVVKQGGERSLQGIGLTTLDPSWGAQAANAGMEITRNLLSKKIKLVKVNLKAGYQVMLVDQKQNTNK